MLPKRIAIFKWILLLIFSRVSSFKVLQFNDINDEQLIQKLLNAFNNGKEENIKHTVNNNAVRDFVDESLFELKEGHNVRDYKNKRLVKRIIPHGYETKNFEYDKIFKTLYKPLVKIHKRKPLIDISNDIKSANKYEFLYTLDDQHSKNFGKLQKDEPLLEPFTIDNMDITYLPKKGKFDKLVIKTRGKYNNYKQPKLNKYSLLDYTRLINDKKIQNKGRYNTQTHDNPFYFKFENSIEDKSHQANKLDIGENNLRNHKSNQRNKPKHSQWFGKVGQIYSKQFKPHERHHHKPQELDLRRSYKFTNFNQNSIQGYIDLINKFNQYQNELNMKQTKKYNGSHLIDLLNSKQPIKKHTIYNNPKTYYSELTYINPIRDINNFPRPIKRLIDRQFKNRQPGDPGERGIFGPIGYISGKKYKQNERKIPKINTNSEPNNLFSQTDSKKNKEKSYNDHDHVETSISNKFKLLNEIAQLKANNVRGNEENENKFETGKDLRALKSGEDDIIPTPKPLWDYEDATTTKPPKKKKPIYSLWNYWTYDKQIHEDECQGQLVQNSRLCVEAR